MSVVPQPAPGRGTTEKYRPRHAFALGYHAPAAYEEQQLLLQDPAA